MVGQLMGIDRPSVAHVGMLEPGRNKNPHYIWHRIVYNVRFLSLILGLPCDSCDIDIDFERYAPGDPNFKLEQKHSAVAKRLLARRSKVEDYSVTQEIDAMLLDAAETVPNDFWSLPKFDDPDWSSQGAFRRTLRAMNQVKHYSLVNCLHLPYLLRESPDQRYEYSKIACLMASREILRRYNAFRIKKPILSCCRPLDFIALIAALTVALAHLNAHRQRGSNAFLPHQRPSDRALIEQVLDIMRRVAKVNDDTMTYQSVCLLGRLMHIEADAFQGHNYTTEKVQMVEDPSSRDQCTNDHCRVLHIDIPYYGTIRIAREGASLQGASLQGASFKVGVGYTSPQPAVNSRTTSLSGTAQSPSAEQQRVETSSSSQLVAPYQLSTANPAQLDFSNNINDGGISAVQQHLTPYPDLTATVDDWAFQGVDTAFFGNLMGGNDTTVSGNSDPDDVSNWAQLNFLPKATEEFFKTS
jgi:hypothetical protein